MAKDLDNFDLNYLSTRQEGYFYPNANNKFGAKTNTSSNGRDCKISRIFKVVDEKRQFYRVLCGNIEDAEDLKQEIILKLLEKTEKDPEWLDSIENLESYVFVTARNVAFNLRRKDNSKKLVSYDDLEENLRSNKMHIMSDRCVFESTAQLKLDSSPIRKELRKLLESFSPYEKKLIQLSFFEGCKPLLIAEILLIKNHDLLKSEFPKESLLPKKEFEKTIQETISKDCNVVNARFRHKLRKKFKLDGLNF
jgi:RNA polymerase sigma factor (sigma-70 family)